MFGYFFQTLTSRYLKILSGVEPGGDLTDYLLCWHSSPSPASEKESRCTFIRKYRELHTILYALGLIMISVQIVIHIFQRYSWTVTIKVWSMENNLWHAVHMTHFDDREKVLIAQGRKEEILVSKIGTLNLRIFSWLDAIFIGNRVRVRVFGSYL